MKASAATVVRRQGGQHIEREAYQRFLGTARKYWATEMFTALRLQAGAQVQEPTDVTHNYRARVEAMPTYQIFAWFERHLQRMRYSGPHGLVAGVEAQRQELLNRLSRPLPEGLLELNEQLELPAYFLDCDVHQHPGGLAGDELAAYVYRDAVQSGVVGVASLHNRFVQCVLARIRPLNVIDLGCGFGRSTLAFAAALPETRVTGLDLAASCVKVAAHDTPEDMYGRVKFLQADATRTGLPAQSADLVTSTMLLHEMPQTIVRQMITEAGRLVAPGGMVAHLDFLPPDDPLLRLIYEGHAARNNEPYLLEHSRIDLEAAYREAGFCLPEVLDFAETDDALESPPQRWRLPWKVIVAIKE